MNVKVASNIGFCSGVNYTIKKINDLLNKNNNLYCLGSVVHNDIVLNELSNKGLITIEDINDAPDNSTVIIRAHGEPYTTYIKAKEKNINIIDLTCGKVLLVHKKIEKYAKDHFIIIIGKASHVEIIGTFSYAGLNSVVVNHIEDINKAYDKFKYNTMKKVYVCAQTTYSMDLFHNYVDKIKEVFKNVEIIVDNTICESTRNRQFEVDELTKISDIIIVVGSIISSNTTELLNKAKTNCDRCFMVNSVDDLLNIEFKSDDNVRIISGASTSIDTVNSIKEWFNEKGNI